MEWRSFTCLSKALQKESEQLLVIKQVPFDTGQTCRNSRNSASYSSAPVLVHSSTMVPTLLVLNLYDIVNRPNNNKSGQVQEIIKEIPVMQQCHFP